jgi:hypothetical protein
MMGRTSGLKRPRNDVAEFGDFQTPEPLARTVCKLLARRGLAPACIVEPTCGAGSFLLAALDQFPTALNALGIEINANYVDRLTGSLRTTVHARKTRVLQKSFFDVNWSTLLRKLPEPILVVGNPPWVTNSELGAIGGSNLPEKQNLQNLNGLAALTGKSNFDISEWMLMKLLEQLDGRRATLAMLCKTAVARKVISRAWESGIGLAHVEIRRIDAAMFFDAAVDACLVVGSLAPGGSSRDCGVYRRIEDEQPAQIIGFRDGQLLADVEAYDRLKHLEGEGRYQWRSGIKHDCSKVMEFREEANGYRNGLGELVELEGTYLYPMLKSSELTDARARVPRRWMLVTQRNIGGDTNRIRKTAPLTWKYLQDHGKALDRRASSIYRKRPRFSVFGVGNYSFAPWKVAISGFYKKLNFVPVGRFAGKPIVLDDTAYFIAGKDEPEALGVASLLNTEVVRKFFEAFIFWDAKRPITVDVLRKLNFDAAARELELSGR